MPTVSKTGTVLLYHADNADTDASLKVHGISRTGATYDATIKKFGTHSVKMGDVHSVNITGGLVDFAFGTGDFTISFWIYTDEPNKTFFKITSTDSIEIAGDASNKAIAKLGGTVKITSTTSISLNTWVHLELIRTGTTWRLFFNGTQEGGDVAVATSFTTPTSVVIGGGWVGAQLGFVDELLVMKGIALHTANFTVPTAAYSLATSTPALAMFKLAGVV